MLHLRTAAPLLMLPVAAVLAYSEWCVSFAIGVFQARTERVQLKEEVELGNHLDVVKIETLRRVAIKNALIADLISGRVTLAEVTKQFLVLNQSRSEYMTVIRSCYPGNTDEEKAAHNVMGYVAADLVHSSPAHRNEVLTRLRLEFDIAFPAKSGEEFLGEPTPTAEGGNSGRTSSS